MPKPANNHRPAPITVKPMSNQDGRQRLFGARQPMNADAFQVNAIEGNAVELLIYGVIGWPKEYGGVEAQDVAEALGQHSNPETVYVRINSPGGYVFDGIAIYNLLVRHKARVVVTVDGIAASIASVIAMAGDEVRMSINALMMIHDPWSIALGSAEDMRREADLLDKLKAQIVRTYETRSNLSAEQISQMMSDETWLDAEECVENGFADLVEKSEPKTGTPSNHFDFTALRAMFPNMPDRAAAFFVPQNRTPEKPTMDSNTNASNQNEQGKTQSDDTQAPKTAGGDDAANQNRQQNQAAPTPTPKTQNDATQPVDRAAEGKKFIDAFGETNGAKYFAAGMTFAQAQDQAIKDLKAENQTLADRLNAAGAGGEAVDFQDSENEPAGGKTKKGGRNAGLTSMIRINGKK